MKAKRFLVMMVVLAMIMSCMAGISATAEPSLFEGYEVTDPESSVSVVADNALTFTNNQRSGVTATGMTKSEVYDSEKNKNVMKLTFNEKANTSGVATDVLASLDGLAALMKDGSANTISFDYKVTGTLVGNIAMFFVGASATDLSDNGTKYPAIGLRNKGGIAAFARPNANRAKWYDYVGDKWISQDSDNKQWNRLTIAVDENGTKITAVYINGQAATFQNPNGWGLITDGTTAKGEIDKILFNTEGAVTAENSLAILLDNIKVYEGDPKLADTTDLTSELTFVNDTSNPGFANMTDGYAMDPVRGAVRQLMFNAKAAETNTRAGLSGLSKYMTDEKVNTICFDYKLSGSSTNHVGFFLNDTAGAEYWSKTYASMILGNSQGIQLRNRPSSNGSDWYSYGGNTNRYQATPNNREWNRAILEVNNVTGEVKGYINREYYGSISGATTSAANLDTIFFNTEPLVGAGGTDANGSLSILLDNIEIYPGAVNIKDADYLDVVDADGFAIDKFEAEGAVYVKAGVKNETSLAKDYIVILAVYDSRGACIDIKIHEIKDVQQGAEGLVEGTSLGLTLPNDAVEVKAFLWDTWSSIKPLRDFDAATLKTAE